MIGRKQEEDLLGGNEEYFIGLTAFFCCWPNDFLTKIICNSAQNPFKG